MSIRSTIMVHIRSRKVRQVNLPMILGPEEARFRLARGSIAVEQSAQTRRQLPIS
jgi:hypothetical protein